MGLHHIAALVAATLASAAHSQQFPIPGKPVRIVVPLAAGGGGDNQARIIAQRMAETLGVPVIIDNKPGASTLIGSREVQRAAPDGHTLLYTIAAIVQLPLMSRKPPWNAFTDFTPIATGVRVAQVLTAHVSGPFNTLAELVAYAKANPGKLSYSSFGVGTGPYLNGERFKRVAGIELVHVPYKGAGEAMRDQLSGNIVLSFDGPTTAIANVQTGRVKFIATAAETRSAALPEVPTMRELGYDVGRWGYTYFLGPPGMPPAVVEAVYSHIGRAIARPDVKELLEKVGNEVSVMSPAETMREMQRAHDYWAPIVLELGIRLD